MAASHYYSHKELQNKNSSDKHEMLHAKGVNWNSYPAFFKRGTFVRRVNVQRTLSELELSVIPEKHQPSLDQLVTRTAIVEFDLPLLNRIQNLTDVLFSAADVTLK